MKIGEGFYHIFKFKSSSWVLIFIIVIGFFIFSFFTILRPRPSLQDILQDIDILPIGLFLAILIFYALVNLPHLLEHQAIRDFKNQLQQFKLRMKFLFFWFSFEGEFENKKFEINISQEPSWQMSDWLILYRLYNNSSCKIIIEKSYIKKLAERLGFFQKKLEISNQLFKQKYYIKTDNLTKAKSYLEREDIQKTLEELIDFFEYERVEISPRWIQLYARRPWYNPYEKKSIITFSSLFKSYLDPNKIIITLEKLKILTK